MSTEESTRETSDSDFSDLPNDIQRPKNWHCPWCWTSIWLNMFTCCCSPCCGTIFKKELYKSKYGPENNLAWFDYIRFAEENESAHIYPFDDPENPPNERCEVDIGVINESQFKDFEKTKMLAFASERAFAGFRMYGSWCFGTFCCGRCCECNLCCGLCQTPKLKTLTRDDFYALMTSTSMANEFDENGVFTGGDLIKNAFGGKKLTIKVDHKKKTITKATFKRKLDLDNQHDMQYLQMCFTLLVPGYLHSYIHFGLPSVFASFVGNLPSDRQTVFTKVVRRHTRYAQIYNHGGQTYRTAETVPSKTVDGGLGMSTSMFHEINVARTKAYYHMGGIGDEVVSDHFFAVPYDDSKVPNANFNKAIRAWHETYLKFFRKLHIDRDEIEELQEYMAEAMPTVADEILDADPMEFLASVVTQVSAMHSIDHYVYYTGRDYWVGNFTDEKGCNAWDVVRTRYFMDWSRGFSGQESELVLDIDYEFDEPEFRELQERFRLKVATLPYNQHVLASISN